MAESPSAVDQSQLDDLHIVIKADERKKEN